MDISESHQIELVLLNKKIIYPINNGTKLYLEPTFLQNFIEIFKRLRQENYTQKNIIDKAIVLTVKYYMQNIKNKLIIKYYRYLKQKFFSSKEWFKIKKTMGL